MFYSYPKYNTHFKPINDNMDTDRDTDNDSDYEYDIEPTGEKDQNGIMLHVAKNIDIDYILNENEDKNYDDNQDSHHNDNNNNIPFGHFP